MALEFLLGLGLALVLVDELRGKRFILPILVLPVMMIPVVVALIWRMLWDNQYGADQPDTSARSPGTTSTSSGSRKRTRR